jgi:DNA-directed RNA polymerase specialized sigma24 family protein
MTWFHSRGGEQQERPQDRLASSQEIQSAFTEQRDYLYWIALLITGDKAVAEQAVVPGSKLSAFRSGVFRDWLIVWANHATMRTAVRAVRDLISASASRYAGASSEYSDYEVLSDDEIRSLRQVDPLDIIAELDPLARSALVLRGIQHDSIADCALLLEVPRRIVAGAYRHALRWNGERTGVRQRLAFYRPQTEAKQDA